MSDDPRPASRIDSTMPPSHRMLVPELVSLGTVVTAVSSLGAPLVPTIAREYSVSLGAAQWALTITLLTGAVLAPILGRLADGPHRRTAVLGALATITFGCACASIPANFAVLLFGRALQGAGLGLMPLAMSIARDHLPSPRAASTVAVLSVTTAAGVGLGYPLSGVSVNALGLPATFLIAGGICALVGLGAALVVPPSGHRPAHHVDLAGAALLGSGLAALVVALSESSSWGSIRPASSLC